MSTKDLARKFKDWCGFWLTSLVTGLLFTALGRYRHPGNPCLQILVVLIEHIGDVVVSIPLLKALRTIQPTARISVLVSATAGPLLEHCPYIDRLIVARPASSWWKQLVRAFELGRPLRNPGIDMAFVPKDAHNRDFNELICILAGSRQRISRARPQLAYRIKPLKFAPFYNRILIDSEVRHEVEQRLNLAKILGNSDAAVGPEAWLTTEDLAYASHFLSGISGGCPVVAFGIGASAGGRQWPLENYARVIELLGKELNIAALLIVGPSEADIAAQVALQSSYPVYISSSATVRQSTALIQRCALFIGNDSGPMHLAASVGVPVVEISAHPIGASSWSISSPERFGPYGVPHRVLQPPPMDSRCARGCVSTYVPHCIIGVTPDEVVQAALQLLREAGSGIAMAEPSTQPGADQSDLDPGRNP